MSELASEQNFTNFMTKLSRKDNASWKALYNVLEDAIKHWLRFKYKAATNIDSGLIDEIYQDAMAALFEVITNEKSNDVYFQEYKNLKSYAIGIAKFKANEAIRKSLKFKAADNSEQEIDAFDTGNNFDTKDFTDEYADKELVKKLLNTLDPLEKEILTRFSRGEKLISIAKKVDISQQNCRIIKFRALKKLSSDFKVLISTKNEA